MDLTGGDAGLPRKTCRTSESSRFTVRGFRNFEPRTSNFGSRRVAIVTLEDVSASRYAEGGADVPMSASTNASL